MFLIAFRTHFLMLFQCLGYVTWHPRRPADHRTVGEAG
jgi:hypothetical protein